MARIWKFDAETGNINIEKIKNFKVMLMNSKFNKCTQPGEEQLIATGGHEGIVTVWNASNCQDVATLSHTQSDPNFEGLEIDWQNSKSLAVTGKSKNIFLWDITTPLLP
jgi:WD40 repeat protein